MNPLQPLREPGGGPLAEPGDHGGAHGAPAGPLPRVGRHLHDEPTTVHAGPLRPPGDVDGQAEAGD